MNKNFVIPHRWLLYAAVAFAVVAAALVALFSHSDVHTTPVALATPAPTPTFAASERFDSSPSVRVVTPLETPNPTTVRPVAPPTPAPSAGFAPAGVMIPPDQMRTVLMGVRTMLTDFRTLTGGNPVGTNAEIMKELMGDNKKGAKLGPPEGQQLNAEGELLDPWGTPYFFHQLSAHEMEIRSAGPDRMMWTDDDQVIK